MTKPLKKVFLTAAFLAVHSVWSQPVFAAKLFLIGGDLNENNTSIFTGLIKATGKNWNYDTNSRNNCSLDWEKTICPKIAVVTSGSENLAEGINIFTNDDTPNFKGLSYYHLFQKWGFSPKQVLIAIDNYTSASVNGNPVGDSNIALINQADIVFFNGGDQSRHARAWINNDGTDSPILKLLRTRVNEGSVIISGSSAGTAIQGQTIYGEGNSYGYLSINDLAAKPVESPTGLLDDRLGNTGFQYEFNGGKMIGFGFLTRPIAFDTHFDVRGRLGRMIVAMKQINAPTGIGSDENTAIFINGDEAQIFGEHSIFIADSSHSHFLRHSNHMNVKGISLSLLSDGDHYNLKTHQLTSSKPLITKPHYKGHLNNYDIFNSYSSTQLITRLIDQSGLVNQGFSDKSAPGFHYIFKKNKKTRGYFDQFAYTADHVMMDILDI